jgi:zinc transport system ATP-binding protein
MIEIKNLYFSYNKTAPYMLDDISLSIKKGDYVSILGENGSGKSTLIKLILNTLKPCKGIISVSFKKIGYVPQRLDGFNSQFPITVWEMLNCHRKAVGVKDLKEIDRILKIVGMEGFKNSLIGNLSGGQQQKVFIARAMMGNPELLILDEPSTGVDLQSQREIYGIIKDLNMKSGITVVSVEHNLEAALSNSKYLFKLEKGKGYMLPVEEYKRKHQEVKGYAAV